MNVGLLFDISIHGCSRVRHSCFSEETALHSRYGHCECRSNILDVFPLKYCLGSAHYFTIEWVICCKTQSALPAYSNTIPCIGFGIGEYLSTSCLQSSQLTDRIETCVRAYVSFPYFLLAVPIYVLL
jgi:hypothetical protein